MSKPSELSSLRNKIHEIVTLLDALSRVAADLPASRPAERVQALCNVTERLAEEAATAADALIDAVDLHVQAV